MRLSHSRLLGLALAFVLASSLTTFAAKKYQVTGVVLQVTEKLIVVQKPDDEKWEIERTPDLKVEGNLKVGSKVTVFYHMVADSAEVKDKAAK